ncbi:hypothetical protein B7P43_G18240 [Cryptotermes secundus]|uniref:Uncharacterized protein n=2 Tax=Cryptotermes secundus TaxID=105785 RepID=A0A2J7PTA4_9NEOP|nr:hypothetical protein B7P43_G18240 [Cryptotermes secundus]
MSNVLPELQTVNAEFQECEIMFSTIETKLQEKLGQVQKSYEELCKDFKISKSKIATKAKVSSPTLSPVCAAVSAEDVYITDQTPVRDVNRILCNKQTKSEAIADIELNPRLLQTPEFDREYDSPLHTSNLPSARKEHKTPACKSICTFRGTTNKKSHAGNLCSLTSSLVKKKKSVGKALQFQSVPRMNVLHRQSRAVPSVVNELFEKSPEETQERIPATSVESKSAISTPSQDCFGDVTSGMKISPADLLCSPNPKEAEQQTKGSRRKSLDAIIERYLKVRKNMDCT